MLSDERLEQLTVAATVLGWTVPMPQDDWPIMFDRDGKTWTKDHMTCAADGEVQCAEYTAEDGDWLIVYNE